MQREPVHSAAGQSAAITDGALRAGPLTAVPSLLRELGQDPGAVFAALGCSPQLLENSENAIPFTLLGRLFDTCTIATGCPHFGLLLGQRMGLDCVGLVGMVARHSPTVKEALSNLLLYMHLHDRGAVPTLAVVDEEAVFGYTIYQPGMTTTASVYDACAAIACNALGTLCGPRWRPTGAQLPRSRPDDPEPYRRVFGLTPTFAAERMALTFAADWLERPVPGADPTLYRVLREQAEALAVGANDNVVPRVRRIACNLLLCGSGSLDRRGAALDAPADAPPPAACFRYHLPPTLRRVPGGPRPSAVARQQSAHRGDCRAAAIRQHRRLHPRFPPLDRLHTHHLARRPGRISATL